MKTKIIKKQKPAVTVQAAPKVKAAKATKCIALDVGHRSCPCPDCNPDGNYSRAKK